MGFNSGFKGLRRIKKWELPLLLHSAFFPFKMTASSNKTFSLEANFLGYSKNTSYVFLWIRGWAEKQTSLLINQKKKKAITRKGLLYKRGMISIFRVLPCPSMWNPSENDGWRRETCGICLHSDRTAPEARSGHPVPSKLLDSEAFGNANWQPNSI